ncbi:DNA-3-methyladenine glycosylase 2 family protein [Alteromonas sp. BMJM2]|uniref:DNA-3-methyladenine glycosylase 2 family protein n=1 Tax=Alteromonas sp. BMJM2 TaxID=2954241 RepID=UPI0022B4E95B|nr:AlkA N-terminal domain-containing protein [Alteromonas sp. BMJM2]
MSAIVNAQQQAYASARCSRDARFDGRFFVAVKTTGIFCRPICPAKLPKEENVAYYHLAVQAMSDGFRPCLRCRPDSAPQSPAWEGVDTTVQRALSLLSEIPAQPISHIASRLGISERYANKLLTSSIGLSPKQFQTMQQALFAKQLIQQTTLPLLDVAISCGFSSQRQLQRVIQQYCKTSPSGLRRANKKGSQGPSRGAGHALGQKVGLFLSYRPPYNWPYVREFLAGRAVAEMEVVTESSYQRWFEFDGVKGQFCATHNARKGGFEVAITLNDLTPLYRVIENIKAMLDLKADPMLIERGLLNAGLIKAQLLEGLRLPSAWSVFEAGCRAIVGQQVSVKAAIGQLTLLVHHLGKCETGDDELRYSFPSASAVASSDLSFLRMPQARKNAIKSFAQLFSTSQSSGASPSCSEGSSGSHFPSRYPNHFQNRSQSRPQSRSPSHEDMLAVKGVGPWTVDYIKMRGERDPDVYLEGDLIVKKMAKCYPVCAGDAAPWRSYLTLQLWQLSQLPQAGGAPEPDKKCAPKPDRKPSANLVKKGPSQ